MSRALQAWRGQPWLGPEMLAAALAVILVEAEWITRGFGLFLLMFFTVPVLWVVTLACVAWSITNRRAGRSTLLALLLLVIAEPLGRPIQTAWDWTGVTLWSVAHRSRIDAAAGRDAIVIVIGWGDWGWAGGSTFAYVTADAQDASGTPVGAERWRRRLHLDCPVAYTLRIRAHLYLVETTDCPFDGISLPE